MNDYRLATRRTVLDKLINGGGIFEGQGKTVQSGRRGGKGGNTAWETEYFLLRLPKLLGKGEREVGNADRQEAMMKPRR